MATTTATGRSEGEPLAWGSSREMNALEAVMWRAEADPTLRSTICGIELLDRAPDWERFRAAHEWATRMVPRFRRRVVEPGLGLGQPRWVLDERFDLDFHVRRMRLPEGATFEDALREATRIAMTAFDKARSPWEAVLIEGLPDGQAAYVLKMHHSATDGIGAIQLLTQMHSRQREPTPDKPWPALPPPEDEHVARALARQATGDARAIAGAARGVAGRVLRRPDRALRDTASGLASARRVLADPPAQGSPLLADRGMTWRFVAMDVPFADLRAAGKAAGGSLNDAFLASLMGAFRRYHEELGCPVDAIPMAIPISVRKDTDAEGGNAFAAARLAGPVGIADAGERIQAIRELIRGARSEPAMDAVVRIAPALARLPGPAIARLAGGMATGNDLQASNVPGLRDDAFLAGAQVLRLYPFAPVPGCAAMVTLVTHGSTCCIGANLDVAAVKEPDRFARNLREGFDEVLALR
ncbi:MAG TPA: wax ester/triacylglycerol synthase domain-containing protein [Baekduia sp.]|nr:wax ester/triacylglycerol synthase domain-containing protein [Baekduia sp.]